LSILSFSSVVKITGCKLTFAGQTREYALYLPCFLVRIRFGSLSLILFVNMLDFSCFTLGSSGFFFVLPLAPPFLSFSFSSSSSLGKKRLLSF